MKKIFLITLLILSMNIAGFSAIYSGKGLKLHGDSASSMGKGGTGISSYGVDLFHSKSNSFIIRNRSWI